MKIGIFDDPFHKKGLPRIFRPSDSPAEASEVVETDEVNEATEVLRPGKSLLRTSESSIFLNSDVF